MLLVSGPGRSTSWPALKRSSFATFAIVQSVPKMRPSMFLDHPIPRSGRGRYHINHEAPVRRAPRHRRIAGAERGRHRHECLRFPADLRREGPDRPGREASRRDAQRRPGGLPRRRHRARRLHRQLQQIRIPPARTNRVGAPPLPRRGRIRCHPFGCPHDSVGQALAAVCWMPVAGPCPTPPCNCWCPATSPAN